MKLRSASREALEFVSSTAVPVASAAAATAVADALGKQGRQ
jgi:hypothetical protein